MAIQDLVTRPNTRISRQGSVLITDMTGPSSVAELDADFIHQQNIAKQFGHFSSIAILHTDTMGGPNQDVKARAAEQAKLVADKLVGTAIVVVGGGMAATLMRTVLVGYFLLTKAGNKQKAFSTIEEAVTWLKGLPGQDDDVKKQLDAKEISKHFALDSRKAA